MNIDGPYILSDSMNTYLVIKVSFPPEQLRCTNKFISFLLAPTRALGTQMSVRLSVRLKFV